MIRMASGIGLVTLVLVACEQREVPPEGEPVAEPAAQPDTTPVTGPEPTASAVWSYMQSENYRSWPLFPGTTERYPGTEPHGAELTTHVNDVAHEALSSGTLPLPEGSVIVKENYMPDGSFDASTVMYKSPGFDPEHNDWFWAKYDEQGEAEVSGRAEMCQSCHGENQDRDYLMTDPAER